MARRQTDRNSWPRNSWDAGVAARRSCWRPEKDNPALIADPLRNNNFNFKQQDPMGYAAPLGAHIRRMNPRDTAANMNRRRMIRRGATCSPPLARRRARRRQRSAALQRS